MNRYLGYLTILVANVVQIFIYGHRLHAEELPQAGAIAAEESNDESIVRAPGGKIDYVVNLAADAPTHYPNRLLRDTHFADYHRPEVVNVVADIEKEYGIAAHSMTSWSSKSFTAFLTYNQAAMISRDWRVDGIAANTKLKFSYNTLTDNNAVWNDQLVGSEVKSWGKMAVNTSSTASTGRVLVYVLDAGVGRHVDLTNVIEWVNPIASVACGSRAGLSACTSTQWQQVVGCYTHATGVAGVIGANADGNGTQGVYPGVKIVSVTASSGTTNGTYHCLNSMVDVASLKSGIDWIMHDIATNNTTGLTSVVNVSSNWSSSDSPKMLEVDMSTLASAAPGALIVQAAGNDYQAACSHAYAGTGPSPWMASIPRDGIMVVGAVNNHGQQVVPLTFFPFPLYMESPGAYGFWKNSAQFGGAEVGSNYGPCVDIWAPGDGIYMPLANPTVHIQNQDGTVTYSAYGFGSGTSFAAPHVAGLAAKLIETTGLTTPSAAESAVRANSYALTDPNGQSTKDVSSRAMNMVTLNGTHPSPSSKSYGEIYIQGTYQQGGVGRLLNSESINGFPTMPYTQTQAGVVTQHPFVVSFNSRGGGCTVNRQLLPSGSLILIGSANQTSYNIVGNPPSQEASAIDDWNPLNDGSQVWAASSDCFPNGTRVTN